MRIYKYTLPKPEEGENAVVIEMAEGAQIVNVTNLFGKLRVFALVDPEADAEERSFEVWPTGVDIPEAEQLTHRYVFFNGGGQAYHLFERT